MNDIHFYSAYARTDINRPFLFELGELEIEKVHENGTIELKYPYSYCQHDITRFFGEINIDKEIVLGSGTVYYSTDKDKCKDFLLDKMKEQDELADNIREHVRESKLEIKLLEGSE